MGPQAFIWALYAILALVIVGFIAVDKIQDDRKRRARLDTLKSYWEREKRV